MNLKKKIIISIMTKFLITFLGLVINKIIAIQIGAYGIAILSQLKSFVLIAMQIGIIGANNLIIKLFTRRYKQKSAIYSTIFILCFIINLFFLFIFIFFNEEISFFLTSSSLYTEVITSFLLSIPSITLISLSIAIATGKGSQLDYALFVLLPSFVFLLLIVFTNKLDVNLMINYFSISFAISSVIIFFYLNNCLLPSRFKINYKLIKLVLIYGITLILPFLINNLLMIYLRHLMIGIDQIHAGYWQSVFQINDNIVSIIYIYIITVLLPVALKYKNPFASFEYIVGKYYLPIFIYIVLTTIFYIYKEGILTILYSKEFVIANDYVIYQIIGDFFKVLSWMFSLIIISYGLFKIIFVVEFFNLIVSLVIIEVFVDSYGIIGCSYAYLIRAIMYFCMFFCMFYINIYKYRSVK